MRCAQCDRDVPDGTFCTVCGARQGPGGTTGDRRRLDRFAANPSEPVVSPGIFSTLFPHLGHDAVNEFKWVFLGGIGVLVILSLLGLITAAIILSAFLVPVLYLMYLYEVRIYRDAPDPGGGPDGGRRPPHRCGRDARREPARRLAGRRLGHPVRHRRGRVGAAGRGESSFPWSPRS